MGIERFNKHYERKCYFLMYTSDEFDIEVQETFHISERYNPLMCLKMAYDFGKKTGNSFRILLSDHITEVDDFI